MKTGSKIFVLVDYEFRESLVPTGLGFHKFRPLITVDFPTLRTGHSASGGRSEDTNLETATGHTDHSQVLYLVWMNPASRFRHAAV